MPSVSCARRVLHANKNASSLAPRLCIRASLSFKSYLIRRSGCVTARRNFRPCTSLDSRVLSFFLFFSSSSPSRDENASLSVREIHGLIKISFFSFIVFNLVYLSFFFSRYRNDEWLGRLTRVSDVTRIIFIMECERCGKDVQEIS